MFLVKVSHEYKAHRRTDKEGSTQNRNKFCGIPGTSLMEEEDICGNLRLGSLTTTLANEHEGGAGEVHTSAGPAPMPLRIQAPMKLPYVLASARQMLLARHMMVEKIRTGRRPKEVWIGTLVELGKWLWLIECAIPNEVTETQHENADTSELHDICQTSIKCFHELWKHRCQRKRSETLCERYCRC